MVPLVIVALAVRKVVVAPVLHTPSEPDTVTTGIGLMVRVIVLVAGAQGAPKDCLL